MLRLEEKLLLTQAIVQPKRTDKKQSFTNTFCYTRNHNTRIVNKKKEDNMACIGIYLITYQNYMQK